MRDQLLAAEKLCSVEWRDGVVHILDQRGLPAKANWLACASAAEVAGAIRIKAVRGSTAPAIAAAYGVALSVRAWFGRAEPGLESVLADIAELQAAAPGLLMLSRVMLHMGEFVRRHQQADDLPDKVEAEAVAFHGSDREANLAMAEQGAELIRRHAEGAQGVIAHGNIGALATGGFGTGLAVVRAAWSANLIEHIYVSEARPLLQGAHLSAWELAQEGVELSLMADSAASHLLKSEHITWLILGAERVAANGDVIGVIGSYQLAVAAMHHGVRVMVVAASSSIDLALAHADDVALEEGSADSLLAAPGESFMDSVQLFNPLFDVTPGDLVDYLVTEIGVVARPDTEKLTRLMCRKHLH